MIVIKEISLNLVGAIDDELGYNWRDGVLPDGELEDCVDVKLEEAVILKAYADGTLTLDIGGNKTFLASGSYKEVVIS